MNSESSTRPLNVISLCDGISMALMAFKELGIEVNYHAIEIDKFARRLSDDNFEFEITRPTNDIYEVTEDMVESWPTMDWVIFGFACQKFSVAGKQTGLEGDPLLFKCMEIVGWLKEINPTVRILIENVKMSKKNLEAVNEVIGLGKPTLINSALVSAQNRQRYYWTNFKVEQPEDRGIVIADILDEGFEVVKYSESNRYFDKDGIKLKDSKGSAKRIVEKRAIPSNKSLTLTTGNGCGSGMKSINLVKQLNPDKSCGNKQPKMQNRVYGIEGKSIALTSFASRLNVGEDMSSYRKLTVRECARLQTVPEWFRFDVVSKTQSYKALGNGFTVDVIAHIISQSYKTKLRHI